MIFKEKELPLILEFNIIPTNREEIISFADSIGVDSERSVNIRRVYLDLGVYKITEMVKSLFKKRYETSDEVLKGSYDIDMDLYRDHIKKLNWEIQKLDDTYSPKDSDFKLNLESAKSVSIQSVLVNPVIGNRTTCPFHEDKRMSMMIRRNNTVWCFHCNKSWDAIGYVMSYHGMSFRDAVRNICIA